MSVIIEDHTSRLTLHHYQSVDENTSEEVKKTRGLIYDDENNLVCSSYSYTPEFTLEDKEKYEPLLHDLSSCAIFRSEEGTLLRLFFDDNRWKLSTHKRINAFDSKWSSNKSFGDLFMEALEYYFTHEGKEKMEVESTKDLFDQFCNTLDRNFNFTFLLRTNHQTKIVCDQPEHPTVFFAGFFQKDGLWCDGNPTLIPSPKRLEFASLEELETYVQNVNPFEHQGVIIMLPDRLTTIKIISSMNMKYKQIRGCEPDITMAYFRVRKSKTDVDVFTRIFRNVNTNRIEESIYNVAKYIHKMYVRRFIKKQYTVINPVLYQMMKVAHAWHCLDRENNIVTLERLLDIMDEQPYMNLYRTHIEFSNLDTTR